MVRPTGRTTRWTRRRNLLVGALLLVARTAAAGVTQPPPGNEVMPQPTGAAEIAVVSSRGFPSDAVTLTGLFKYFAGGADVAIDPVNSASTTPGSFSPQCGLKAAIVLKGGGCANALGWYNATEPATMPAAIYPFVPSNLTLAPPNGIGCSDADFCPLATRTSSQTGIHTWADPLPQFDPAIQASPNWTGGRVGLALIGSPGSQCPQTKYSQADLNDKSSSGAPWITALVYPSVADPGAYYLAFEDLPTCAASWRGCTTGGAADPVGTGNDGDFNDFVFYISGLTCPPDGGVPDAGAVAGSGGNGGAGAAGGSGTSGAAGTNGGAGTGGAAGTNGNVVTSGAAGTGGAGTGGSAGTSGGAGTGGSAGTSGGAGTGGSAGTNGGAGMGGSAGTNGGAGTKGTAGAGAGGRGIGGGAGTTAPRTGCGCRTAEGGSERSPWGWALLLALVVRRRNRSRSMCVRGRRSS